MLGRLLLLSIGGLVGWKYRDAIREYLNGNVGPAREKVGGLLRTVQETSETLLDRAKEDISSRLERARETIRAGAPEAGRGGPYRERRSIRPAGTLCGCLMGTPPYV